MVAAQKDLDPHGIDYRTDGTTRLGRAPVGSRLAPQGVGFNSLAVRQIGVSAPWTYGRRLNERGSSAWLIAYSHGCVSGAAPATGLNPVGAARHGDRHDHASASHARAMRIGSLNQSRDESRNRVRRALPTRQFTGPEYGRSTGAAPGARSKRDGTARCGDRHVGLPPLWSVQSDRRRSGIANPCAPRGVGFDYLPLRHAAVAQ